MSNETTKKPIIFIDFGGVYFRSSYPIIHKKFAKRFNLPFKRLHDVYMKNWELHATGKMTSKQYWKYISSELNLSERQTEQLRRAIFSYSKPNPGMLKLIRKLKKKYTVVALSSITSEWTEALEKRYAISKHFHQCHYTFDHGCDKPDAGFFMSAAKKMRVEPQDCIVVDDWNIFLAGVKKTGARVVVFKNSAQLEKDLIKLDVKA